MTAIVIFPNIIAQCQTNGKQCEGGNMGNNHVNRRNHVANAYHEDVYAKVINDKVSQSIRDGVAVQIEGVVVGRQNNRELGLFCN